MQGKAHLILGIGLAALTGCIVPVTRSSSDKEGEKDLNIPLVASIMDGERGQTINSAEQQVHGVGLVVGLNGTGDAPHGAFRNMLERELHKQKIEQVTKILDDPNHALVLVSAVLRNGMRKGDLVEVNVALPPNSRARSLRGGELMACALRVYQSARGGRQEFALAGPTMLAGDVMVRAAGTLVVDWENGETAELKRARIWEGGQLLVDRPFYLVMKKNDRPAILANSVAERLNGLFRDDLQRLRQRNSRLQAQNHAAQSLNQKFDTGRGEVARPATDFISLNVPFVYSLNPERYLSVASLVPLRESSEDLTRYRQRLARMLLESKTTVNAAQRLEALGQESLPVLKEGFASPSPLVRFAAAEALTYLGCPAGVEELAGLAKKHRELRYWCLLALASLNESVCRTALLDLLKSEEPELRYGAFYALRLLSDSESNSGADMLHGQKINNSFWLHHVAVPCTPSVHLLLNKRAEAVLFGKDVLFRSPVGISAGGRPGRTNGLVNAIFNVDDCLGVFTIAPGPGPGQYTVSRLGADRSPLRLTASDQLADILRKMGQLGARYDDVVDFLRKADERGCLNCPLHVGALPTPLAAPGSDARFLAGQ